MAAMLDQVLSSGTGLLLIVLVARNADAATLGALSVALLVNGFFLGVVRGGVCEVVLLRCRARPSRVAADLRNGLFLAIGAGLIVAVVLLGAGAVLGGELGAFVSVVAVAAPFVYSQDLLRYVAYGRGRIDQAIALDGTWFGVQLVVSVALVATGGATPVRLAVAWAAGAAVAAVAACLLRHVRPSRDDPAGLVGRGASGAAGFVGDFLVSTGMVQLSFLLLGAVLPLAEFAALRVAFVALIPLANLLAGVRTLTLAHLAGTARVTDEGTAARDPDRAGVRGQRRGLRSGAGPDPPGVGRGAFGDDMAGGLQLVGIVAIGRGTSAQHLRGHRLRQGVQLTPRPRAHEGRRVRGGGRRPRHGRAGRRDPAAPRRVWPSATQSPRCCGGTRQAVAADPQQVPVDLS